ncbi:hypothetical protein NW754_010013 [Fusarium falciforme]|uniref:Uncharacterized protein n=1 Tax=Fusarium falciforme TaxID=195108 RepID=A0A9W8RBF0_9HYPO|nr:Hypothetical protein NCS54_00660100 [Fusarium falciforme]KAJ4142572.1 hypothetical protein NW754_010013 [Fusarium falciforme]KAJ4190610.1 hypothetical protein NW767_011229 [Fusarium falciforme]KAJ4190788.1 hypothetical protein NW755_004998 [Fusarium falciforme]KAJ4257171.1 hypothetical protein NW757_003796 [Fusarium falciforme]WAO89217.1 Hypothetical protein NCS54_00660100 [Fusarium falciforme]
MRFAKHVLPLALVITGVIAAGDESTTEVAKAKATATDDKATQTTAEPDETKGSDKTEEPEPTATGDDEDKDKDSTDKDKETETKKNSKAKVTSATETEQSIVSWNPPQPSTMAPDINASSRSIQTSGYMALTMVGIVSIAAAFL